MTKLENLGELIYTDVLIVGGGIGGLVTAIKAKEQPIDVLIVEKATTGWSGKGPKGGGILYVLTPQDDLEAFVEYQVRHIGDYLTDQELLHSMAKQTYGAIEQIAEWGAHVTRNSEGKLDTFKPFHDKWSITGIDLNMLKILYKRARKMDVKILNKVQIVELLKRGDRVVGAVGFDVIDGKFYIIKAKATVLANGSCNYMVMKMWSSGRGDGIAAAYRAGAEMRNAEFGNFYKLVRKSNLLEALMGQYALLNADGEYLWEKYNIPEGEPDITIAVLLAIESEVREKRGPIRIQLSKLQHILDIFIDKTSQWHRPQADEFWRRYIRKSMKYGPDSAPQPEAMVGFLGELSPVKVDHEMRTSLEGLWAIGDTSYAGSACMGAVPAPPARIRGSGLMNALMSGIRGGASAAAFASAADRQKIDYTETKRFKKNIYSPIERDKGVLPEEAIQAVQNIVCPLRYNVRRSKERLEEALSGIERVQSRLPELYAKDGHGLAKCHEAANMALCAEMTFRAALMRTESRGWHFREDYPERKDINWLKWLVLKNRAGKMTVSTEPVPMERYKIKPEGLL